MERHHVVLAAPCILDGRFQASAPAGETHWGLPFVQLLETEKVRIIPLPCTESGFCGNPRGKHGVDYYNGLDGYREYCGDWARETVKVVLSQIKSGQDIIACLGVEHSPSCAVSYMYTRHGTIKQPGIFFEQLFELLDQNGILLEKIGINRGHPGKAYRRLQQILGGIKCDDYL